ncbi:DUF2878 domain-containing protein [Alteromonas sp. a30]|uniref:DUF2878 domain-containing protein n=1 Tax=Alteromonas sp. a30 TaxID=2730917 RepID=UPI00227FC7F1|nr:DUF2878 domain-containing protein [Alteromonas sp. a30]MCY7295718.1 DUF2878 domain-containing protein [Alteromonas sp. a30]
MHVFSRYWFTDFFLFQAVWVFAVVFHSPFICILLLLARLYVSQDLRKELGIMCFVAPIGIVVDWLLSVFGVFHFEGGGFPFWMILLWCAFSIALTQSFYWLSMHKKWIQSTAGAIFGPLSYIAGWVVGAVDFGLHFIITTALLSVIWMFMLPILYSVQARAVNAQWVTENR